MLLKQNFHMWFFGAGVWRSDGSKAFAAPSTIQSPPKDPQQIAIENAQSFLSKPDAVMEHDAPINLLTLAQASDAQTATIGVVMLQDRGYD